MAANAEKADRQDKKKIRVYSRSFVAEVLWEL
jgi:hypothetical protein